MAAVATTRDRPLVFTPKTAGSAAGGGPRYPDTGIDGDAADKSRPIWPTINRQVAAPLPPATAQFAGATSHAWGSVAGRRWSCAEAWFDRGCALQKRCVTAAGRDHGRPGGGGANQHVNMRCLFRHVSTCESTVLLGHLGR